MTKRITLNQEQFDKVYQELAVCLHGKPIYESYAALMILISYLLMHKKDVMTIKEFTVNLNETYQNMIKDFDGSINKDQNDTKYSCLYKNIIDFMTLTFLFNFLKLSRILRMPIHPKILKKFDDIAMKARER